MSAAARGPLRQFHNVDSPTASLQSPRIGALAPSRVTLASVLPLPEQRGLPVRLG